MFLLYLYCVQVQQLISELNEILAHEVVDEEGLWKNKLTNQSLQLFDFLPEAIQEQLMLERDPHGNVQVHIFELLISWLISLLFVNVQTSNVMSCFLVSIRLLE